MEFNRYDYILDRCNRLLRIAKHKGYKPFWVISILYEEFDKLLLHKKVLGRVAGVLNTSKKSILTFVKEKLQPERDKQKKLNSGAI